MYKEYTYTVLLRLQTSPHCVISVDSQGSTMLTNCRNFQKCSGVYFERIVGTVVFIMQYLVSEQGKKFAT